MQEPEYVRVRSEPELVREFLATRDVPCPGCGYNLRGLTWSVYPECQRPIILALDGGLPHQRIRPALTLLAGVAAWAASVYGILMFLYQALLQWQSGSFWGFWVGDSVVLLRHDSEAWPGRDRVRSDDRLVADAENARADA